MKNPLHYIQTYPHRSKQLLGISYDQFLQLVNQAAACYKQHQLECEQQKVRINAKGGGRTPKLTIAE